MRHRSLMTLAFALVMTWVELVQGNSPKRSQWIREPTGHDTAPPCLYHVIVQTEKNGPELFVLASATVSRVVSITAVSSKYKHRDLKRLASAIASLPAHCGVFCARADVFRSDKEVRVRLLTAGEVDRLLAVLEKVSKPTVAPSPGAR